MEDDIVARLRDFQTWQFRVPECGHHQNTGATAASIFVPEAKTKRGWVPVLCETGYSDGWRRYMFNPLFMLKEAADEIERLRERVRIYEGVMRNAKRDIDWLKKQLEETEVRSG